jgi:hypothetical protein
MTLVLIIVATLRTEERLVLSPDGSARPAARRKGASRVNPRPVVR